MISLKGGGVTRTDGGEEPAFVDRLSCLGYCLTRDRRTVVQMSGLHWPEAPVTEFERPCGPCRNTHICVVRLRDMEFVC